jgi:hypothetical protein
MAILSYDRTRKALDVIGTNIVGKVKFQMGQAPIINASGKTSASVKHTVFQSGNQLGVGITSRKRLGHYVLEIIDKGRKAGEGAPPKDIKKWIKDKGIPARKGQSLNQQAYMINRSLRLFGVRPRNVFDKAIGPYKPVAEQQLLDAIGADLDQFVDENMPKKT